MRLLLDQGLPRGACALLSTADIDATHVADLGMADADDSVILVHAKNQGAVVVTLDADFHKLLALSGDQFPSVVRIRIEGLKSAALASLMLDVVKRCETDLVAGAVVSVEPTRIRVHKLPLF